MRTPVITIGNIVADLIATSIERFPEWGEQIEAKTAVQPNIGGNAANFAVCLTKLGISTTLIGKVGKDVLGETLLNLLKKIKVDVSHVSFSKLPTSTSLIASNLQGERGVIHYIGANSSLTCEDVDIESFQNARILHLCAYYLLPSFEGKPAETILKKAKDYGLTTTFDVAWDVKGIWKLGDLLKFVDFFLPNEKEAAMITGKTDPSKSADAIIGMGAANAIIKLGSKGCLIRTSKGEELELPAYKVPVIDTTGAGDAFDAGFVYGLLKKWPLEKAGFFANAVAALTLAEAGGTTSAPSFRKVLKFSRIKDT